MRIVQSAGHIGHPFGTKSNWNANVPTNPPMVAPMNPRDPRKPLRPANMPTAKRAKGR
jgi:hypothetical protein